MENFDDLYNKLPLCMASFAELRAANCVYVDKTDLVYKIASNRKPKILVRPRRFGKSTLLSTVKELFLHGVEAYDGHDSYFKGLKIEKLWQDQGHYHVLHLDFAALNFECDTAQKFKKNLRGALTEFAASLGISLQSSDNTVSDTFIRLVINLPNNSLVLLIDEHDAPLLANLEDKTAKKEIIAVLKGIYGTVKSYSEKFRCVFVTGITRYQDLGLGTAGNTMRDISFTPAFSTSCGYTREELKEYFYENLIYAVTATQKIPAAEVTGRNIDDLLDQMTSWYDGFCFDDIFKAKVFSTWSVLNFFGDELARFLPYWANEEGLGMPQLLKSTLSKIDLPKAVTDLSEEVRLTPQEFENGSLVSDDVNPHAVLFETGYLTLTKSITDVGYVYLGCPNLEIKLAYANLLALRLYKQEGRFNKGFTLQAIEILSSLDETKLVDYLNSLFAAIPYHDFPVDRESAVAALVMFNFKGADLEVMNEVAESRGRADTIINLREQKLSLVFEYKFEKSADDAKLEEKLAEAISQIKSRDYGHNANSQAHIARFALVFCGAPEVRRFVRCVKVDELSRAA